MLPVDCGFKAVRAADNEQTEFERTNMIALNAFLVFLGTAALPVIFLLVCRRWIERDSRQSRPDPAAPQREEVHPAEPMRPRRALGGEARQRRADSAAFLQARS
jgi:hypothetical protein